ncbi:class I SAM-dependent methyltransferase [Bacteroidota bacterium]
MNKEKKQRICPVESSGGLDNPFRKLLQNPKKLLNKYISQGMTVLDLGCGPGFFSIEIAKLLNDSGKVIAADLQEGMLDKVRDKIKGTELEQRVKLHKCQEESIDITEKVDFVLAFYMIHEVPNQDKLFKELKSILNPNGIIYIIEPKFHVSKKTFGEMINRTKDIGFELIDMPKVFFSRTVLLTIKK